MARANGDDGFMVSDFGCEVTDIIGLVWRGIYHIERAVLHKRVEWVDDTMIEIVVRGELATFDADMLTRLVATAHDQAVRVSVSGAAPGYLRIRFHKRQPDIVCVEFSQRHPGMGAATDAVRRDA